MGILGSGSTHLSGRYGRARLKNQSNDSVICQRCLERGHWTYECKKPAVYISRPSRTQQLRNPKLRQKFLDPREGFQTEDVAQPAAKRQKRGASSSSSSSSGGGSGSSSGDDSSSAASDASASSSGSEESSSAASSSSSDASSSGSGSSSSSGSSDASSRSQSSNASTSSGSESAGSPPQRREERRSPAPGKPGADMNGHQAEVICFDGVPVVASSFRAPSQQPSAAYHEALLDNNRWQLGGEQGDLRLGTAVPLLAAGQRRDEPSRSRYAEEDLRIPSSDRLRRPLDERDAMPRKRRRSPPSPQQRRPRSPPARTATRRARSPPARNARASASPSSGGSFSSSSSSSRGGRSGSPSASSTDGSDQSRGRW